MSESRPTEAKVFKHESVRLQEGKAAKLLCKTDLLVALSQTIGQGGETNLHSHKHLDGFWFVLRGRARFYTTDDKVIGELGQFEGILIPREYPYWFERVGDENLELLQVEASDHRIESLDTIRQDRIDYTARRVIVDVST